MKTTLTPGRLFALLTREFKERKPSRCHSCRTPLPCLVEGREADGANWHVDAITECPHGCHALLADIASRLRKDYDLVDWTA